MAKTADMLTDVDKPDCAELQSMRVIHAAKHAEELTAGQYVANISLLPVTSQTSHHMCVTHAGTDDIATRISISTLPSMQMQQPAAEDPKAGRESV